MTAYEGENAAFVDAHPGIRSSYLAPRVQDSSGMQTSNHET